MVLGKAPKAQRARRKSQNQFNKSNKSCKLCREHPDAFAKPQKLSELVKIQKTSSTFQKITETMSMAPDVRTEPDP
jgi:hypothetical protein